MKAVGHSSLCLAVNGSDVHYATIAPRTAYATNSLSFAWYLAVNDTITV